MASMEAVWEELEQEGIQYSRDELMKKHTSFKIGGPAKIYCRPGSEEELLAAVKIARKNDIPVMFLGLGSNVLFLDEGYDGMIVHLTEKLGATTVEGTTIRAGAGASLKEVCIKAREAGLTGLEFAYGIPGSVGGAVYMDAGAFEGEIRQVLESVTCLNEDFEIVSMPVADLAMGYRASIFQLKPWCVLSATFKLREGEKAMIDKLMQELLEYRQKKQPLDMPSAGSAFKRPQGAFAGALIDQSGLRGFRVGDAAISEKHCGFIVNLGDATSADVLSLADQVVNEVKQKTGFVLEKEIQVVRA